MSEITVVQLVQEVGVTAPGPQGPQGPPGSLPFEHVQSTPSASWLITHNFGRRVHTTIFDDSGTQIYADVEHGSDDQATITFPTPTTGSAVIS